MAAGYDAGRGYRPEVLRGWLERIARHAPPAEVREIVDLGAGTGRYSAALAAHFGADVLAVEPSETMLAEARKKPGSGRVRFVPGTGEAVPAPDASADLVFLSMVYHHLADPDRTAGECRRVLRPGGRVALRNGTREATASYPHVRFFAGIAELIAAAMPPAAELVGVFEHAGFTLAAHEVVAHEMAAGWSALAAKWTHRADSLLARLPDAVFEAGMTALRAHATAADPGEAVTQHVDLFVFRAPAASG